MGNSIYFVHPYVAYGGFRYLEGVLALLFYVNIAEKYTLNVFSMGLIRELEGARNSRSIFWFSGDLGGFTRKGKSDNEGI